MRIKNFIEEQLEERGWRKSQLAKKLGISAQHLNTLLHKDKSIIPPTIAIILGKLFDKQPEDIMLLSCKDMIENAKQEMEDYKEVDTEKRPFVAKHIDQILEFRKEGLSYDKIAKKIGAKSGSSVYVTVKRFKEKEQSYKKIVEDLTNLSSK